MLAGCPAPKQDAELPVALARRGPAPIVVSSDPWVLSTDTWDDAYRGAYLGNGYLGQRVMQSGTALSGEQAEPAFMAGGYRRESLATVPPLLPLRLESGGKIWGADGASAKKYHQELLLKEGILLTRAAWDAGAGEADLELETALLRQHPDVAVIRGKITNRSRAPISVVIAGKGLPEARSGRFGTAALVNYKAPIGDCAAYLQVLDRTDLSPIAGENPGFELPSGQVATFALVTQVTNGTLQFKGGPARFATLDQSLIDRWFAEHRREWEALWEHDLEIEGDAEAQQVVRACLFQLFSSVREENHWGVPPMGLSANAFSGHVFWDMDSWMLPSLLPQHPELARAMLEYRFRTLDGAKANARKEGLPGASYAWESAATGRETIPGAVFSHGRHVSGDVALALKQFYAATGDRGWLQSRAWPILRPTAENWVARAKPDGKGGFVVRQVTTPDELAGQVDHSAWTHHVARVNLDFATETGKALGQAVNPKWSTVSPGLSFLRDPATKLILPYAGFTERTKAKQADVLLLAHPGEAELSAEELGRMYNHYAPRVIANGPAMTDAIYAVAAARLGRGEEALKRFKLSYQPFVRPPFHLFSEKRTRDNLAFLTGAAGVVEAVVYGFGGLRLEPGAEGRPRLEPHLPPGWTALRIRKLHWRGKRWDVEIKQGAPPVWTPA